MSIRTDEVDPPLRAALLETLAGAVQTVPTVAPPWPATRATLLRIGRRRRLRTATAALGCAALVAAGTAGTALRVGAMAGPAARSARVAAPEPPEGSQAQVGFPLTASQAWFTRFARTVAAHPPWWASPELRRDLEINQPVRPDQVQVLAAEELGGLRVVQVQVSVTSADPRTGRTTVGSGGARYGGPAGADPATMIRLSDQPDAAAWPDPAAPGWVEVLSTRMVDDVQLHVRDGSNRVRTVALGNSLMARVYAPGARYVSLLNGQGDHELLFSLPVRPLDLEDLRAQPPSGVLQPGG